MWLHGGCRPDWYTARRYFKDGVIGDFLTGHFGQRAQFGRVSQLIRQRTVRYTMEPNLLQTTNQ